MKVKLKLDSNKLKQFALAHVEKAVFGVLAVVALMLMFKSMGLPKFTKTPDDLRSATTRAQNALKTPESTAVETVHGELKPKQFLAVAAKNTEKFVPTGYAWSNVKPPAYQPGSKREDPVLLAVENVVATPGRGIFTSRVVTSTPVTAPIDADAAPVTDAARPATAKPATTRPLTAASPARPPGGRALGPSGGRSMDRSTPTRSSGNGEGLSYIVVTGKVPYAKQQLAYKEALGKAELRLPNDQSPDYGPPLVERAEVIAGVADKDLKWTVVSSSRSENSLTKGRLSPLRDPFLKVDHESPVLTEQLYALAQGDWDPEAIVPPEFRAADFAATAAAASAEAPPVDAPPAEDGSAPEEPGAFPGGVSGAMGRPVMGRPGMGRPAGSMGRPPQGQIGRNSTVVSVDYLMFRFFDFSAEPGKRYRYRVRLFCRNPNYNVEPNQLANEASGKRAWNFVDQADATAPLSVPNDGSLIAGMYQPAKGPNEAAAHVILIQYLKEGGKTAIKELQPLLRGQLANLEAKANETFILDINAGELAQADMPVKFRNNIMLLDVNAAERGAPADVLVMNADGKLVVISAEAEQTKFQDFQTKIKAAEVERRKAEKAEKEAAEKAKDRKRNSSRGGLDRGNRMDENGIGRPNVNDPNQGNNGRLDPSLDPFGGNPIQ